MRLSAQQKHEIIDNILKKKQKISDVAKREGIARKTIYQWLKRYSSAHGRAKVTSLDNHYIKERQHPKYYRGKIKHKLLQVLTARPEIGVSQLAESLKTGRHAVVTLLKELNLSSRLDRENFSRLYTGPKRLHSDVKAQVAREVLEEHKTITEVCNRWHIARKTLYSWLKSHQQGKKLSENYTSGFAHPRALSPGTHKKILGFVAAFPEYSIHKLANKLSISSHGLWNILKQNNLTHKHARLAYAAARTQDIPNLLPVVDRIKSVWEKFTPNLAPAPPPAGLAYVPSPVIPKTHLPLPEFPKHPLKRTIFILKILFKIVTKALKYSIILPLSQHTKKQALFVSAIEAFAASLVIYTIYSVFAMFASAPNISTATGYFFASIALTFGLFFFLYSMKYYISVALLLLYSHHSLLKEGNRILTRDGTHPAGLLPDVTHIELERMPFVSIHVPTFNEKRVVNRMLEAVTSMTYTNFEVIICDDSTDETKDMVADWKNHPRVKISHRASRAGYKGGALAEAVRLMDPRTEFVLVFDADFIPFGDTVEQFLKYFKAEVGSLDQQKYTKSEIAAVQGYQWHVLNKSENWITRGVRTEYAGSYVIERSSAEIYGGLKQISGSVFMIRADILKGYGWGTSITEDFQLTLRLYADGFKVLYTPYVQAPSECVSTIKRLVRQRMRWAEGHSHNIKKMFITMLNTPFATSGEKFEFLYLSPYYLQSLFFLLGTLFWFASEVIFQVRLPFWTQVWGWSLVLTNLLSLPLMNLVGMFLEEAEEKDYLGVFSFVLLTYIVTPFQAYAAVKGFLEKSEGPWFRTPKTGRITDVFRKGRFATWLNWIFGKPATPLVTKNVLDTARIFVSLAALENRPVHFTKRSLGNLVLASLLSLSILSMSMASYIPAAQPVQAAERQVKTLDQVKHSATTVLSDIVPESTPVPINQPVTVQLPAKSGHTAEYIFHPEPRVRTKIDKFEVDMRFIGIDGLGVPRFNQAYKSGSQVNYPELYSGISARSRVDTGILRQEIILDRAIEFTDIEYAIQTVGLTASLFEEEVYFAPKDGGNPVITFTRPFMYEVNHPDRQNFDIEYQLQKSTQGWKLIKHLGSQAREWLADPGRVWPVVVDPSSVIENTITSTEGRYATQQRKITYVSAAWYALYEDGLQPLFEKSTDGTTWTNTPVDIDDDSNQNDDENPTMWVEGTTIWVAWFDNGSDTVEFNSINTASSDALGTVCTMTDLGTTGDGQATIAVADDGDIYVALVNTADTEAGVFRVATGGCTVTDITSGSGVTADGVTDAVVFVSRGNDAYLYYDDGDLSASVYVDDGSCGAENCWDTSNFDVNGAGASSGDDRITVTTDATDIWVLQVSGTGTEMFRCAACPTTTPTYTDEADPFTTGVDSPEDISLAYVSGSNEIIATQLDTSVPRVIYKVSDADTISWGNVQDFGFSTPGAGGFVRATATMTGSSTSQIAALAIDTTNTELEIVTLPENLWWLLGIVPFLPGVLGRLKNRRR